MPVRPSDIMLPTLASSLSLYVIMHARPAALPRVSRENAGLIIHAASRPVCSTEDSISWEGRLPLDCLPHCMQPRHGKHLSPRQHRQQLPLHVHIELYWFAHWFVHVWDKAIDRDSRMLVFILGGYRVSASVLGGTWQRGRLTRMEPWLHFLVCHIQLSGYMMIAVCY